MLMTNNIASEMSIPDYWEGIENALREKIASIKKYVNHPVTGDSAEQYFCKLLRDYIPYRYAVETGFVVNSEGNRSNLIDIIIADTMNIPPLCVEPNYKVFAIESVCAVIEVTTSPRSYVKSGKRRIMKLESDIKKLQKVRLMGLNRLYFDDVPIPVKGTGGPIIQRMALQARGCPKAFIITCGGFEHKTRKGYENRITSILNQLIKQNEHAFINAAFSMKNGMLHIRPYKITPSWVDSYPLATFIFFLVDCITGFQTMRIDVSRYMRVIEKLKTES